MTKKLLAMALASVLFCAASPDSRAAELTEAELYFELNDSAGDLGIHSSIDGGPYTILEIEDSKEGMTQFFLESAEPSFAELAAAAFFRRFPEGRYDIEAVDRKGKEFGAAVRLSHRHTICRDVAGTCCHHVIVDWDPVTQSHPTVGKAGRVEIVRYEFFAEREGVKFAVELPPTVTEFEIPAEVLALGDDFKYEVIARTASGNNTAVEACFLLD